MKSYNLKSLATKVVFVLVVIFCGLFWNKKSDYKKQITNKKIQSYKFINSKAQKQKKPLVLKPKRTSDKSNNIIEHINKSQFDSLNKNNKNITSLTQDEDSKCWDQELFGTRKNQLFFQNNKTYLNEVIGDWFYRPNIVVNRETSEKSIPGLFLLALSKAHYLSPFAGKRNFTEALEILDYIMKADPENSAPFLFAADIHKKLGNTERHNELLLLALKTSRFDTYESMVRQNIMAAVTSPEDLLAAIELYSSIPVVNTMKLINLLKEVRFALLAEKMIESSLDPIHKITNKDSVFSEALIYATGQKILKNMGLEEKRKTAGQIIKNKMIKCKPGAFLEYYSQIKDWKLKNK